MRRGCTAAYFAVLLCGIVAAAPAGGTETLPVRELNVSGASFTTDAWVDMGTFSPLIFPLDDRALIDSPEMAVLCFSPFDPNKERFSLFTHMPMVDMPIAWYYPLNYRLGNWDYEMGENLICQLWECDGNPEGGCDPSKPGILPNATASDDLLGQATLSMGSFQGLGTAVLNLTVPEGAARGRPGTQAGTLLLECPGCRQLWRDNPSWVSPYTAPPPPSQQTQSEDDEPPTMNNSPGPTPTAEPTPTDDPSSNATPPPAPLVQAADGPAQPPPEPPVEVPPVEPQVPETVPQEPPSPPTTSPQQQEAKKEEEPNEEILPPADPALKDIPLEQATENSGSSSTKTTLLVVLAVLGGLLAILFIIGLFLLIRRCCGWRAVRPETAPASSSPVSKAAVQKAERSQRALRVRVQRPADAEAALRRHRVDGAIAELPSAWAPRTT